MAAPASLSLAGTLQVPLSQADELPQGTTDPQVTMVFCSVDNARNFVLRSRKAAFDLHQELVAVMRSVLRQVSSVQGRGAGAGVG